MKRLIGRLAILLSIAAGPLVRFDEPAIRPIRESFQCLFSFQTAANPTGNTPVVDGKARPSGTPGIRNREALRGLCLINSLPLNDVLAGVEPDSDDCPLEFLCAEQGPDPVAVAIAAFAKVARDGSKWIERNLSYAVETAGSQHVRDWSNAIRNPESDSFVGKSAASPSVSPATTSPANDYWDYYGDCDRWGLVFRQVARPTQADGTRRDAVVKTAPAGEFPMELTTRVTHTIMVAADNAIGQLVEVAGTAVHQLADLSRSFSWGGSWVSPPFFWRD